MEMRTTENGDEHKSGTKKIQMWKTRSVIFWQETRTDVQRQQASPFVGRNKSSSEQCEHNRWWTRRNSTETEQERTQAHVPTATKKLQLYEGQREVTSVWTRKDWKKLGQNRGWECLNKGEKREMTASKQQGEREISWTKKWKSLNPRETVEASTDKKTMEVHPNKEERSGNTSEKMDESAFEEKTERAKLGLKSKERRSTKRINPNEMTYLL